MREFIRTLAGPLDHQKRTRPDDRRGQHRERGGGQHAGLLLHRYLCEKATGKDGNPKEKRALLDAAINAAQDHDVKALYQTAYDRWCRIALPKPCETAELAAAGRLIVGLGTENVLETGLRLHHTYGLPIIPGSALKGLAAHYCDHVWGERHVETASDEAPGFRAGRRKDRGRNQPDETVGDFHRTLFGTTVESGCILFHDAWYVPGSSTRPLVLDVMTPHHSDYNRDPDHPKFRSPTDFDSPTPVPFLSAAGSFHVAVSWCGPEHKESADWTKLALSLLKAALAEWGVGGKTSSGYGRLVDSEIANRNSPAATAEPAQKPQLPKPGDKVDAVLLEVKTKKGGWNARHEPTGLEGAVQNTADVPDEKNPGDALTLIVASANERQIAFRYPTPADEERARKSKGQQKRGKRPGGHTR